MQELIFMSFIYNIFIIVSKIIITYALFFFIKFIIVFKPQSMMGCNSVNTRGFLKEKNEGNAQSKHNKAI